MDPRRGSSTGSTRTARLLQLFLLLSTVEGLAVFAWLVLDSPLAQGAWILGFSRLRVLILGLTVALSAAFAWLSRKALLDRTWVGQAAAAWSSQAANGRTFKLLAFAFYVSVLAGVAVLVNGSIRTNWEPGILSRFFSNRGYLLFLWLSLIALQALLVHFVLSPEAVGKRLGILLVGAVLLILSLIYWYGAEAQLLFYNVNRYFTDQSAYMNYARLLRESGYRYPGDFNRMPLYPWLQSLLLQREMADPEFFLYGKYLNLALSMAVLLGLAVVFFSKFTTLHALNLISVAAFSVFIYKAGWFQSEVLFYFINFGLFVLMSRLLHKPSWRAAIAAGLVAGLAHLTKASVLPGLAIFFFYGVVRGGMNFLRRNRPTTTSWRGEKALQPVWVATLVGLVFLLTISPYLLQSKRVTGRYFYNVNSTFYMWYDSWEEARAGTRAHGDRVGWPDTPPEATPSMAKYLREHTPAQMATRLVEGGTKVMNRAAESYGYLDFVKIYAGLLVLACAARWGHAWASIKENPVPVAFALTYFPAYVLLYFWYAPIAYGDRLLLAQFLPLLYALSVGIHAVLRDSGVSIAGRTIRWLDLANLAILPFLISRIHWAATVGVYTLTGGG
jgi:hypothetical protein